MDVKTLALILLLGRIVALSVIFLVLRYQFRVMRMRPDPELKTARMVLMTLALAMAVGNVIPIMIDIAALNTNIGRNNPNPLGISYAVSNMLTSIVSASAVLALYMVAERLFAHDKLEAERGKNEKLSSRNGGSDP